MFELGPESREQRLRVDKGKPVYPVYFPTLLAFGEGTFSPFGQSDPNATVHTACDTCQQRGQERRYSKTSELRPGTRFLSNKSSVGHGVTVITLSTLFTPPVLTQELAINVEWSEGEG